ncbi:MAG TPA: CBS domain-containing protein [candidate division Zixibacteria bacterium]|nr:CBS domain-containing protein [candidate division Zixibacteria bacterium]
MTNDLRPATVNLRVADLMTPDPITIPADATVEEAEELMRRRRITGLPVVDHEGRLVGVISQSDLLYLATPAMQVFVRRRESPMRVGQLMSSPPVTIEAAATLLFAARRMHEERLHRLVAVDEDGRPIGVLSSMDFVALAARC